MCRRSCHKSSRLPQRRECEYLNVWFRCRAAGGRVRADGDESTEVGWFDPARLPELDDWSKLRIDTTLNTDDPTWYAQPGERHRGLTQPDAI